MQGMSIYDDLINVIVGESFEHGDACLYEKSIAFEFKFPESFAGGISKLSSKEKTLIEQEFNSTSIDWNSFLEARYKSNKSPICLHISKPIFFRNNELAFVYKSQSGSEFYNIYEKVDSEWQFKENIITVIK